jgi:glutaredoxin 3
MAKVIVYTKNNCPYCAWAKQLLDSKKIGFQEINVEDDPAKRNEVERLSGRRTLPQIFINDQSIGGYDDLSALVKSDKLNNLLK